MRALVLITALLSCAPSLAQEAAPDYPAHIAKLKQRLPGEGYTILIRKPFVVVGNEAPERVRQRADRTVKWCVDLLKAQYFPKDPGHIIDVWLFKDKATYRNGVKRLTGDRPGTPFGFYSPAHRGLFMNIATGGGTLVHEIVHPFMEANFPACPSWFNEGLASLYEQCRGKDGKIWGLTNWRLRGLQRAIRDKALPPFADLLATTRNGFYNADPGTNYAQARYLCYYLQEQGLLDAFYRRFRETAQEDPTGAKALREVLKVEGFAEFQKTVWEPYVLRLRF